MKSSAAPHLPESRVWKDDDFAALSLLEEAAWVYDAQRCRIWWGNEAACRLWRVASLADLRALDSADPSDATRTRLAAYAARFAAGERVTERWTFYPGGEPVTATCAFTGIRIEDGRMAMLVIVKPSAAIVPDDLRGIEALRHTRVRVSLYGLDGACLMRNPAALRSFPEPGHHFRDRFVDPADADAALAALAAEGMFGRVIRAWTHRGERWLNMDARKIPDPVTGDAIILVSERDVSGLIRVEEALRVSERRLAHMVDNLPAGAVYVEGERIFLNPMASRITGYTAEELPTLDAWFETAYPDRREEMRRRYDAARRAGAPVLGDYRFRRKDGTMRWARFSAYLSAAAEVWLIEDVTEHRQALDALSRERAMLRSLIESMPDLIFFKDHSGRYIECNRAALGYAGRPKEQALGLTDHDLFGPEIGEQRRRADQATMEGGLSRVEEWFVYPDGRRVLMETIQAACRDDDGGVLGVVGVSRDITAHRHVEEKLRRERVLLQGLIDAIPDAILFKDQDGRLRKVNKAFAAWCGVSPEQLSGLSGDEIWPSDLAETVRRQDALVFTDSRPQSREMVIPQASGGSIHVEMLKAPIHDACGTPLGLVGVGRDITARKRMEEDLRRSEAEKSHLANHDPLTGLPNRRLFFDRLDMALIRSRRTGRGMALLFIDLDGFKQVNDAMGHEWGDQVLRVTAQRLLASLRKSDTVARVGGDEFTVILEDITSLDDVNLVAGTIVAVVSEPIPLQGTEATVGASIGIALHPLDASDGRTLLAAADGAMYRAKQTGRSRHVFYANHGCAFCRPRKDAASHFPTG